MAQSEVEIANRALGMIGHEAITSFADSTTKARLCRQFYYDLRDEMLRSHPWNFAMRRVLLPALATAPAWEYAYAYQLPDDCLRVWKVDLDYSLMPWKVEGRTITTDQGAPLSVLYIGRVAEVGSFDAIFTSALCARLAEELAMPIAQSAQLADLMHNRWRSMIRNARSFDAQEGSADRVTADYLLDARLANGADGSDPRFSSRTTSGVGGGGLT